MTLEQDTRKLARTATLALAGIEGVAAIGLLRRNSVPPIVLGRYAPEYAVFLTLFAGLWLLTFYMAWRPIPPLVSVVKRVAVWMRKRWWLFVILLVASLEGWYALGKLLQNPNFLGGLTPGRARRPVMTALMLMLVWATLIVLFAGRTASERRSIAANVTMAVVSATFAFWLISLVATRIANDGDYQFGHDNWARLFKLDLDIGYTGKPNLDRHPIQGCPAETQRVTYSTDGRGFRNPPGVEDAPLVIVGDSFVYGTCLHADERWSAQLSDVMAVEVATYALPGYSLWHYNRFTDRYVRRGDHEVLIYGLVGNDLLIEPDYENSLTTRLFVNNTLFYKSPVFYAGWLFLRNPPSEHIADGIANYRTSPPISAPGTQEGVAPLPNGIQLVETDGRELRYFGPDSFVGERLDTALAYADEMGLQFALVTIPSRPSAYIEDYAARFPETVEIIEQENVVFDEICAWMVEQGTLCYNMTADFREAASDRRALYFTTDGHWNAAGAAVAAELTAAFLTKHGIRFE